MKHRMEIGMAVFLIIASVMMSVWSVRSVTGEKITEKVRVLIDAGHGGKMRS